MQTTKLEDRGIKSNKTNQLLLPSKTKLGNLKNEGTSILIIFKIFFLNLEESFMNQYIL